jgi:hypothetical protein
MKNFKLKIFSEVWEGADIVHIRPDDNEKDIAYWLDKETILQ